MSVEVPLWRLRAQFAIRLATLYGREVPAYTTLVEISRAVNADVAARHGHAAERLGSIDRVTAERHGAIRVGSGRELAQIARVFAGFGMHPVGFYDLRDASASSVPVVSTAFRPIDAAELARNPFRVFTSMLTHDDRRFFDADIEAALEAFIGRRTLFGEELLGLAERSAAQQALAPADAERFLDLATAAFELSSAPIDRAWYSRLERISAVAADIGGVGSTHINHLTPRVLDIDELYARMQQRGISMIDEIQGPPRWAGPDVLLRQTSFKALAEECTFLDDDGQPSSGALRVRFGEVEQRGIALTGAGRDLYDRIVAKVDARRAAAPGSTRIEIAEQVWAEHLPSTETELAARGFGFFTYTVGDASAAAGSTVAQLLDRGALVAQPIVYEDFLPRSAAGIFQSNLTDHGSRNDDQLGTAYDLARLSEVIGQLIHDPIDLYAHQQQTSLDHVGRQLGLTITTTAPALQETHV